MDPRKPRKERLENALRDLFCSLRDYGLHQVAFKVTGFGYAHKLLLVREIIEDAVGLVVFPIPPFASCGELPPAIDLPTKALFRA